MQAKNVIMENGFSVEDALAIVENAVDIDRAAKSITLLRMESRKEIILGTDLNFGSRKQFDFSDEAYNWTNDTICEGLAKITDGSLLTDPQNAYLLVSNYVIHSNCDAVIYCYWYKSDDNSTFSTSEGVRRKIYTHPRDNVGALIATAQGDVQITSLLFITDTANDPLYHRPSIMVGLPDSGFSASADVSIKREEFIVLGFPKWAL